MKFVIMTLGTRGDVQPFVALGAELQKHQHNVTICTAENFREFVESYELNFRPIQVDFLKFTQSEEGKKMLGGNPIEIMRNMKVMVFPMMEQMLNDLWTAAQDAEVLIYHPKAFGGYDIAEKLGIPVFLAHPIPIIAPTALFTNPALPFSSSVGFINKLSYSMNRLFMASFFKMINTWRKETLGLSTKRTMLTNDLVLLGKPIPVIYGCSPNVIPFDPSWKSDVSMSGFWFLEENQDWSPPEELLSFMERGIPPIAISFSSMPLKEPEKIQKYLVQALKETNQRGVIITGWSGMESATEDHVYTIDSIPHSWLFPRTSGVIHHGGAGTTAAALKAGKPMVICPFTADQPFWARSMQGLGVATLPLKEKDMSVSSFVDRINQLNNKSLVKKAANLAFEINKENGLEQTIQFIHQKLSK